MKSFVKLLVDQFTLQASKYPDTDSMAAVDMEKMHIINGNY